MDAPLPAAMVLPIGLACLAFTLNYVFQNYLRRPLINLASRLRHPRRRFSIHMF